MMPWMSSLSDTPDTDKLCWCHALAYGFLNGQLCSQHIKNKTSVSLDTNTHTNIPKHICISTSYLVLKLLSVYVIYIPKEMLIKKTDDV